MKLRIARKIVRRLGFGYSINNITRLQTAVNKYRKVCNKSIKEFKRNVKYLSKPLKIVMYSKYFRNKNKQL